MVTGFLVNTSVYVIEAGEPVDGSAGVYIVPLEVVVGDVPEEDDELEGEYLMLGVWMDGVGRI